MAFRSSLNAIQNAIQGEDWRSRLQTASFREVQFFFDAHEFTGGRRQVTHEFPEKNEPFTEDLGRRARTFTLDAHVLGDDYFDQRDALLAALEEDGSGILIHPYLGRREVFVDEFRLSETQGEGRMARISMTFREAGSPDFPSRAKNGPLSMLARAQAVASAVDSAFQLAYEVASLPGDLVQAAKNKIGSFTESVSASIKGISKQASPASALNAGVASLDASVADIPGIVNTPALLSSNVSSLLNQIGGIGLEESERVAATNFEAITAYEEFIPFDDDDVAISETTDTREQEKESRDVFNLLVQATAAANLSYSIIAAVKDGSIISVDQANEKRAIALEFIDEILERESIDDDVYKSLSDLRAELVDGIPDPENLPREMVVKYNESRPALVLAYDLYKDPERDEEITERNNVANPLFVPGGVNLEVLSE